MHMPEFERIAPKLIIDCVQKYIPECTTTWHYAAYKEASARGLPPAHAITLSRMFSAVNNTLVTSSMSVRTQVMTELSHLFP